MKIVPQHLDFILGKSSVEKIEDIPLINLDYNIYHFVNRSSKRFLDIFIAGLGSLFFSPFVVLYALLTGCKLQKQKFIGQDSKIFSSFIIKKKNGQGIRKNLMYFPLIWSVFLGDASMVGSELLTAEHNDKYLRCKPGITGLFQVQGNHMPDEIDKQNYEYYYIQNHSLFLDIEILLKAILRI